MTRCQSCLQHQHIDQNLSNAELLLIRCLFCDEPLLGDQRESGHVIKVQSLGQHSSKLAMGLLGAGAFLGSCDQDGPMTLRALHR